MIPVLFNGAPVYRLYFSRRPYSRLKRKHPVTINRIEETIRRVMAAGGQEDSIMNALRELRKGRPLYETTALICMANAKRDEPPVAKASARQFYKDPTSKEHGRMAALSQLLSGNAFSASEKRAIMAAYQNRTRGHKTAPPTVPEGGAPAQVQVPTRPTTKAVSRPQVQPKHSVINKVVNITRPWFDKGSNAVHAAILAVLIGLAGCTSVQARGAWKSECLGTLDAMVARMNTIPNAEVHPVVVPSTRNIGGWLGSPYCLVYR